MHRDNVSEMRLQQETGRRVFVLMIEELRAICEVVRRIARHERHNIPDVQFIRIAYYFLFFGVGPNSDRMLSAYLPNLSPDFVGTLARALSNTETRTTARRKSVARKISRQEEVGCDSRQGTRTSTQRSVSPRMFLDLLVS